MAASHEKPQPLTPEERIEQEVRESAAKLFARVPLSQDQAIKLHELIDATVTQRVNEYQTLGLMGDAQFYEMLSQTRSEVANQIIELPGMNTTVRYASLHDIEFEEAMLADLLGSQTEEGWLASAHRRSHIDDRATILAHTALSSIGFFLSPAPEVTESDRFAQQERTFEHIRRIGDVYFYRIEKAAGPNPDTSRFAASQLEKAKTGLEQDLTSRVWPTRALVNLWNSLHQTLGMSGEIRGPLRGRFDQNQR